MSDSFSERHKKLLYRAKYRGTKEADCLVYAFVAQYVAQHANAMGDDDWHALETFIQMPDPLINDCLQGKTSPPATQDAELWQQFVTFYRHFVPQG